MANTKKKRTIIDEEIPANENNESPDIAEFVVSFSKVYKINNGKKAFCFQSQEPVDEVQLQTQYPAGGSFIVEEYNGLNQMVNTPHYEIEAKPMVSSGTNGINQTSNSYELQIRMLFDELNWTRQMLMQQLSNSKNNGMDVGGLVQALQGLHSLAPAGKDPIELLIKGMELGKNNGSAGDWKSELLSTAKEVLPPAIQAFAMSKVPMEGQPMMIAPTQDFVLKQGLQWLKSRIIAGMETGLAVSWLIQNVNDPQFQPFMQRAIQGNIDNFIELDSEIANEPYRSWFTKALTEIKEWYAEQQQGETGDDMDGRTGNNSDVTVNETASTRKSKLTKVV